MFFPSIWSQVRMTLYSCHFCTNTSFRALFKELQIEAFLFSHHISLLSASFSLLHFPTLLLSLIQHLNHLRHRGKTRNPEKVEYFQPPIRLPLSSLR